MQKSMSLKYESASKWQVYNASEFPEEHARVSYHIAEAFVSRFAQFKNNYLAEM